MEAVSRSTSAMPSTSRIVMPNILSCSSSSLPIPVSPAGMKTFFIE